MDQRILTESQLTVYKKHLAGEERAESTIKKYERDIGRLMAWLRRGKEEAVTKEKVLRWRRELLEEGKAPGTVNGMLTAVNGILSFLGWKECCVQLLKVQRRVFREGRRQLERGEYERLVSTAERQGRKRLKLLMETICSTGIRVSEVEYITMEAVKAGEAEIVLKGKIRTILLPEKLRRKLMKYAKEEGIATGAVFRTRRGRPLSRRQIWSEMKSLCREAGVEASKVFPHNLRHLFAVSFYRVSRDIVRLADILGHSSIETTRIYLITTGKECARQLNRLGLVR